MTDVRNPLDPTARWRATIDAMEAVMLAAPDAPEIEPTEAEEIRRLITMRLASARRNSLPAAWTRRPGVVSPLVPDTRATPALPDRAEPAPRAPHPATRPRLAWHGNARY